MRSLAYGLALVASVCGLPADGAAALCDAPMAWQGGASADVAFTGVAAIRSGAGGDGPDQPMPILLNSDVLGLGEGLSISAGGLSINGQVICVRYRPEWLGFILANSSAAALEGQMTIAPVQGMQINAVLPRLMPGEVQRVLVMTGEPIATLSADVFRLKMNTSNGGEK